MSKHFHEGQKVVLYTEDFEPITIFELNHLAIRYLEQRTVVQVPVYPRLIDYPPSSPDGVVAPFKVVEIKLRTFMWKGKEMPMLFTTDEENALLLKAAFLPGQQAAINENTMLAFASGFLMGLERLGR